MKVIFSLYVVLIIFVGSTALAQQSPADSLIQLLTKPMPDTSRVLLLDQVGRTLMYSKPLIAMKYAKEGLALSEKLNYDKGKARILNRLGSILRITGNYPSALEMHLNSLKIAERNHDLEGMAKTLNNIGVLYSGQKDSKKAIEYYLKTKAIAEQINDQSLIQISLANIGVDYDKLNQLDSARIYTKKSYEMGLKLKSNNINILLGNLGDIYYRMKMYPLSLEFYRLSLPYSKAVDDMDTFSQTYLGLAKTFRKMNALDSCLYYAKKSLKVGQEVNNPHYIFEAGMILSELYETKDEKQSYRYFKTAIAAKDSMFSQEEVKQVQKLSFNEQLRRQELINAKKEYQNRLQLYIVSGILGIIVLLALILYRNNRHKQKANAQLLAQKDEIDHQRDKAEKALSELTATQAQLIQKEKLASLGELTAGIAHEIQNPLNFVNNFSELSVDLVKDLKVEIEKSDQDKAYIDELFDDLSQNQQKINHHGKRASSIVSGMLEHSRTSTGERRMTDINKLADEYLRLSYHGMRAKYKDFNADYELITDESLQLVNVVPQDIGRVLLNLINNAFWAINVGEVRPAVELLADVKKVIVSTAFSPPYGGGLGGVEIRIKDNGTGIPADILPKIFQPFFTTKPTGEGTGLGLSLAYGIITKGHGGTLEVESVEGEGTTFVVKLPIS